MRIRTGNPGSCRETRAIRCDQLFRWRYLRRGGPAAGLPPLPVRGGDDVARDEGVLADEAVALGAAVGQDGAALHRGRGGVTSGRLCDQLWRLQRRGRGERGRGVPTGNCRHRRRDVGEPPALQVGCLAVQLRTRQGGLGFTAGTEGLEASTGLNWFWISRLGFHGRCWRRLWRMLYSSSLFF